MQIIFETPCALGEGPLWHPKREALFWFDILGMRLFCKEGDRIRHWQFDEHVSAAGWVDLDTLVIASETCLSKFSITTGLHEPLVDLERGTPVTRSNDGRADPFGGFWIGTMGKSAEHGAGAIYRFYQGQIRKLFDEITISNAICFAPNGRTAYFADTSTRRINKVALDDEGWPDAAPAVFVDLEAQGLNPDGAVVDAEGNLWNAQWGASRVACYAPDGTFLRAVSVPATQTSCPAFGGPNLQTLYVTTAAHDAPNEDRHAGKLFAKDLGVTGQREHRVIL